MLFSRKSNPQKIFDYKQFTIINKEFRKNFKSIFNTLDYFNNSVLKITSLELPSLLIDIEDFVYRLNRLTWRNRTITHELFTVISII